MLALKASRPRGKQKNTEEKKKMERPVQPSIHWSTRRKVIPQSKSSDLENIKKEIRRKEENSPQNRPPGKRIEDFVEKHSVLCV